MFGSRAGLEHHAQEHGLELLDDLPDEIDLDLGGWLSQGMPLPPTAEVSELWHLLFDDPVAGKALSRRAARRGLRRPRRGGARLVRDPRTGRARGRSPTPSRRLRGVLSRRRDPRDRSAPTCPSP